jgi:alpha-beta hydrolase superfamily lysophospholipase
MNPACRPTAPFYFGSDDNPLFGWYHPPVGPARRAGVVVCNPIGDDYIRAHRALRHLAERLAQAGFAVMRFDFHGTGDSAGDERQSERVRTWIGDIGRAVEELRRRSGVIEVALAGLRMGATLAAAAAAERGDIDSLILWSPYVSGGGYIDETTRLHKMHKMLEPRSFAAEPRDWQPGGAEALGFLLTADTVRDLERVDLMKVARPARRALVVGAGNVASEDALLDHLRATGVVVDYRHLPGHKFLITSPHTAALPGPVLDAMVEWIGRQHTALMPAPLPPVDNTPMATTFAEEPMIFGAGDALFGILTRPPEELRDRERPAILLLSAGTVHRIGPHRFYVTLARRWARLGFHVLRVDLSGIGDSAAGEDCPENLCYPDSGIADVQAAMNALQDSLGVRRFVLAGLCSGGDLTFQTGMRDRRVAGAVIINPRTFCVHDLELVENYKRARFYFDSLLDRQRLWRLLRGEVAIGQALGLVLSNVRRIWRHQRRLQSPDGPVNDVPSCLRAMADGGVDTLLVASEHDPGVEYVDRHFGRGMRALARVSRFRRADFPGTDHTFTSLFAQELVADTISAHLTRRYLE